MAWKNRLCRWWLNKYKLEFLRRNLGCMIQSDEDFSDGLTPAVRKKEAILRVGRLISGMQMLEEHILIYLFSRDLFFPWWESFFNDFGPLEWASCGSGGCKMFQVGENLPTSNWCSLVSNENVKRIVCWIWKDFQPVFLFVDPEVRSVLSFFTRSPMFHASLVNSLLEMPLDSYGFWWQISGKGGCFVE